MVRLTRTRIAVFDGAFSTRRTQWDWKARQARELAGSGRGEGPLDRELDSCHELSRLNGEIADPQQDVWADDDGLR